MKEYVYVFLLFLLLFIYAQYECIKIEGFETPWYFDSNWWLNTPTGFKWTFGLFCAFVLFFILFIQR
jgi:hypothetical protein